MFNSIHYSGLNPSGHLEIVKILVDHGAIVNPPDHGIYTPDFPLGWAETKGHNDVAAFLKSVGAKHKPS